MARPELRQRSPVLARKEGFTLANLWGALARTLWSRSRDSIADNFGVDGVNGFFVRSWRDGTVLEKRLDQVTDFGAKRLFQLTGPRREADDVM